MLVVLETVEIRQASELGLLETLMLKVARVVVARLTMKSAALVEPLVVEEELEKIMEQQEAVVKSDSLIPMVLMMLISF
jgi:hypothetical protein